MMLLFISLRRPNWDWSTVARFHWTNSFQWKWKNGWQMFTMDHRHSSRSLKPIVYRGCTNSNILRAHMFSINSFQYLLPCSPHLSWYELDQSAGFFFFQQLDGAFQCVRERRPNGTGVGDLNEIEKRDDGRAAAWRAVKVLLPRIGAKASDASCGRVAKRPRNANAEASDTRKRDAAVHFEVY